jgi:hypothetical protein
VRLSLSFGVVELAFSYYSFDPDLELQMKQGCMYVCI